MTPIITTAMLSALACLRQRVSYVLMRGGDDAPLQLVADSVGDVVLTLTIPGEPEPAVLGYVWEEDGSVLYEPDAGGTDNDPLDSDASRIAVCEAAAAAIAAALGGGCESGRSDSGDYTVTTPGGYQPGSLGMSRSLAEIISVGRARLREELAAEISSALTGCHPAAADPTVADDSVALTGPDGARTVIRPATYMILCQEDWEDHVQPVCDAVAHALTAG